MELAGGFDLKSKAGTANWGGQMGSTMTRSKSTEIKNNNTISLHIRALKSHLIIPKNWPDTKRWDSRGGALTLNRGGAKEIIRLNFNVGKLRQEITGIYKTKFSITNTF